MYNTRHYESNVQQGFRYRVLLATKSRAGIIGNEQADSAVKSATTHLPLAVPLSDMKRVIMHHIFKIWQESWSQQLDNKLHSVKPVIGAWPVMPMRRTDVKLTRLRIGHTRFTHRHLLFGERAPECLSCHVSYTVRQFLIDCPVFNHHRITFFHTSILTLSDLCSQLASLDKNALREIKLRLSYLQGKSTTMSVIAHQTEKEWISANEKSRQRKSQTQAEGAAKQHAARLEEAHLRAYHSCFITSERC
ncbi:RNase H domain-containing protein [Trichonephila clavipes]|nr:RNase H domain-containing protein [Trichonephila clavipes]